MKSLPVGKLYYSIRDVSELVGVKPHVLRYWETQFRTLKPRKGRGGARMYRKRDVEFLFEIKKLLYDQRFTIAGARRRILDERGEARDPIELPFSQLDRVEMVRSLKRDLESILADLRAVKTPRRAARRRF